MALFPAFINVSSGSADITNIPDVAGAYNASKISIAANIGDYVLLVAAQAGGSHAAATVNGATLIDSNSSPAAASNVRDVYLYKATATTVSATITSTDRWAMFTLN